MRVRLTKSHSRGTVVQPVGDVTGLIPLIGELMVYDPAREAQRREAEEQKRRPPPDVPATTLDQALWKGGHLVFVYSTGRRRERLLSSTIRRVEDVPLVLVETKNSWYRLDVLESPSSETPTNPLPR